MASRRPSLKTLDTNLRVNEDIDWNLCSLCQEKGNLGELKCPANNSDPKKIGAGYKSVADNLLEFHKIGALPGNFKLINACKGTMLYEFLLSNKAKWHKKCSVKYNALHLNRAKKRKRSNSLPSILVPEIESDDEPEEKKKRPNRYSENCAKNDELCFICGRSGTRRFVLYSVASLQDEKIKKCANITNNVRLQAYLEGGDLVAKEAKYHAKCYTSLTNCLRTSTQNDDDQSSLCNSLAFSNLVSFIHEAIQCNKNAIFKMSELRNVYTSCLSNILGLESAELSTVHSTRLKDRILEHFPTLQAQLSGREYVFFNDGANIFHSSNYNNLDDDAVACERILKFIRRDISQISSVFNGQLKDSESCVPASLLAAVNVLLYGKSSVNGKSNALQPVLSISQLIVFNYRETVPQGNIVRHSKIREPPLPVYIGLSLYGKTRNNSVIENLHERGISISSTRIREITTALCRMEVERANEEGLFCPSNLLHGQFVVGAYDNIDHNLSSTTSESSFHGTAISIFQIPYRGGEEGRPRNFVPRPLIFQENHRSVPELPETYSVIKATTLSRKQTAIPEANDNVCLKLLEATLDIDCLWKLEELWLNRVKGERNIGDKPLDVSWAAIHASKFDFSNLEVARGSLLPLFSDSSSSPSMMKHGMEQIQKITAFLNPDQTPVICVDQPLFALAKAIQWNWPKTLGESKMLVMLAPFHIEQAFLKLLGQLLDGSGWTSIVAHSGIKTEAGAESCLKVTHVTKARAAHEKTAATLYSLLVDAFLQECPQIPFEEWMTEKSAICPTFKYWLLILNLEILLLTFVRSIRTGDYKLFLKMLREMIPWFFVTDHIHYARWLPIHLKDLLELENLSPKLHECFSRGQFIIRKTKNAFSGLAIDQAHEQNNAVIKGNGGAVGLLQDPLMLRRWMLSGPQLINILDDFESLSKSYKISKNLHHEQYPSFQLKFYEKVIALKDGFLQFGNPFLETSNDLLEWDSKIVMDKQQVEALYKVEKTALHLYKSFVEERLSNGSKKSILDPIQKTGLKIFGSKRKKSPPAIISDLKNDVQLFSRAFIVSQNRDLDLNKFFEYENASVPPSLSSNGVLRTGTKSQLLKILEAVDSQPQFGGLCDAIIYDGAALVHSIPPSFSRTFGEYCKFEFKNRIITDIERFKPRRIHIAWDTYSKDSLKKFLREKRGSGTRRKVAENNNVPKNWQDFLLCDENKEELFGLLGEFAPKVFDSSIVTTEIRGFIRSSHPKETSIHGVKCRLEEEADSRIFLHVSDCARNGSKTVLIVTVDTDVAVLATSYASDLTAMGLEDMWLLFGNGKQQRFINIYTIQRSIGAEKAIALRGFHAFTGCDLTSAFTSKGKLSAWTTWKKFPQVTLAFMELSQARDTLTPATFQTLEKFTSLLYYSEANDMPINLVRKHLFVTKMRALQNLPPTKEALQQHCLRSSYQAGQVWGRVFSPQDTIPAPEQWGWRRAKGMWKPKWSTLPSIWDACRELVKCSCTAGCTSRCSCRKSRVPCTLLCARCAHATGINCANEFNKR